MLHTDLNLHHNYVVNTVNNNWIN